MNIQTVQPVATVRRAVCYLLVLSSASIGLGLASCEKKPASQPATQNTAQSGPKAEYTYTVRGEVFELPDPANPRTAFRVHHEAIDRWVGSKGTIDGMNAMTMEFTPGPGVSLEGLRPGTKIQMTFEVWWEGTPPLRYPRDRITKIEILPADTKLEFRQARPDVDPSPP